MVMHARHIKFKSIVWKYRRLRISFKIFASTLICYNNSSGTKFFSSTLEECKKIHIPFPISLQGLKNNLRIHVHTYPIRQNFI